jgi:hypothetical protein
MKPVKLLTGGGLAVAVVGAIAFGIVYGAERNSTDSTPDTAHDSAPAIADRLEQHAAAMRQHGQDMIDTGRVAGQQASVDQGTSLGETAREMETAADMLRRADRDTAGVSDVYRLRADGQAISDTGSTLIEHGGQMSDAADSMVATAQHPGAPGGLRTGAEALKADAEAMVKDGEALIRAAQPLIDEADQLERSLAH